MPDLKVMVVGDASVGKTVLISRLQGHPFKPSYRPTIGMEFQLLTQDAQRLQLWDCSGMRQHEQLLRSLIPGAKLGLLCLDFKREDAADRFYFYFRLLRERSPDIQVMVVGTKVDNDVEIDDVMRDLFLEKIAALEGVIDGPIFTSAKDGRGLDVLKEKMFDYSALCSPQTIRTPVEVNRDFPDLRYLDTSSPFPSDDSSCTANFFFQIAQHPATAAVGTVLMLGGLMAIGIGVGCLCPALMPMMAGVGIVLSESLATSVAIAGGCAIVTGTIATFFYQHAHDSRVAGVDDELRYAQ